MFSIKEIVVVIFTLVFVCSVVRAQGKYSENTNESGGRNIRDGKRTAQDDLDFRSRIVQQVWEKAKKMKMPPVKMNELRESLLKHDTKVMQLKKHQRDGADADGDTEALLRRRLSDIMRQFGMIPPEETERRKSREAFKTSGGDFSDAKINKLWMKAQQLPNFSALELEQLREELLHHQEKQDQFEQLSEQLYGDKAKDANRVDRDSIKPVDPKDRSILELDLKLQHRSLSRDFQRLSSITIPDGHRGDFVEPRIINLWREAQFSNFTEEELESLKTELKHFEVKLTKFETLHVQSLEAEKNYRVSKKLGEPADAMKHRSLREQASDIGSKVNQYINNMRGQIRKGKLRADEL
ncbi:alpha-2-macroglobulin receptor-associated protein-like [Asterias amurensis]|uniref:alpha-2-macroglobulin receptor-associated protein-like n=1 Tax=Asterias amurensis TaxID=7602 RepID=UPI003AB2B4A9